MGWKSDGTCRREGERAFERDRYGRDRNPYPEYGSYDNSRHHRAWAAGFRTAERRHEERQEEELARQRAAERRAYEIEMQRRRAEEEYLLDEQTADAAEAESEGDEG